MFRQGRVLSPLEAADVGRHPLALMEDLDGLGVEPGVDLLPAQGVRGAVVVPLDVDVVVDADGGLLPLAVLEGPRRQGPKRRLLHRLEQRPARPFQLPEGTVVEALKGGSGSVR